VGTEFVAVRYDPARQVRMLVHLRADHEEGRVRVVAGQDVEDLRRPSRIGAVVEGERDCLGGHALAGDLARRVDREDRPGRRHIGGRR
jgi:hypothetical protein